MPTLPARTQRQSTGSDASGQFNPLPPRVGDALTPQPAASCIVPDATYTPSGSGPLAGLLSDGAHYGVGFQPYRSEAEARRASPADKVGFVPLRDDYGDLWLVMVDPNYYDFTALAGFQRAQPPTTVNAWKAVDAYNMAIQGWKDPRSGYAAVIPDQDHNRIVLPSDPSVGAPDGTQFMIIGNVPITIPANPLKSVPALHLNLTGNRWTRIAYFSSNQDVRSYYAATADDWGLIWHSLLWMLEVIVDAIAQVFGAKLNLENMTGGPDGGQSASLQAYAQEMQTWLQIDFGDPNGPILKGNARPQTGANSSALPLALGAVAVVAFLVLLTR